MKTLALILGLFISGIIANAQDTKSVTLKVTIENVESNEGQILAELHTQDTFMRSPGIQQFMSNAKTGSISFVFEDVKPGTYAISSMQDINGNQQMDYDYLGMPSEKYGMSNNKRSMGPPSFQDSQFEVAEENLEINIRFIR
jgi:uncharacterized protein (DUF2141 family)